MTSADARERGFMWRAMCESGEPSARRVTMLFGLLVFAPLLLVACLRWAPDHFALSFDIWCGCCVGAYVAPSFSRWRSTGASTTTTSASESSTTTTSEAARATGAGTGA